MKRGVLLYLIPLFMLIGCDTTPDSGDVEIPEADVTAKIKVTLPDWSVTRAYSRDDLTTPEMSQGEKVAVVNEEGEILCFNVVESENNSAYLDNPDVTLIDGAKYRIQYPYPEVWNTEPFWMALGFGAYESTPTLDWMVSGWKEFNKDEEFHFNLKRINSVLIFDVIAPFDCVVEEIRLASETAIFCIKGAFDCREDELKPDITTWTTQYKFPQREMTWVQGEKYTLMLTVWPYDYSQDKYSLDIYTVDDRGASASVVIPELNEGCVKEYEISEFEILAPPVYKKDVVEQERAGYDIVYSWECPGEFY